MSFDGFDPLEEVVDIRIQEAKRRRRGSAIPDFTGDLDLDALSRGEALITSEEFGKKSVRQNLLGQRGRVQRTPLRLEAEGSIEDAFLTDPLASPRVDPSPRRPRRRRSKRDRGRKSLVKESERLATGGAPRSSKQRDFFQRTDTSFRGVI